jgi:hypothetical protein
LRLVAAALVLLSGCAPMPIYELVGCPATQGWTQSDGLPDCLGLQEMVRRPEAATAKALITSVPITEAAAAEKQ